MIPREHQALDQAFPGALPGSPGNPVLRDPRLYALAALVGGFAHVFLALPLYEWWDRILAWALLCVFLAVVFRFFLDGERRVPLLPLIALQFYVMYGLPQFRETSLFLGSLATLFVPDGWAITAAMGLALAAEVAVLLGYWWGRRRAARTRSHLMRFFPEPHTGWKTGILVYVALSCIFEVEWTIRPDLFPMELRNFAAMLFQPYLAFALCLLVLYRWRAPGWRGLSVGVFSVLMLAGLISGMMEGIVVPIYIAIVARWVWTRTLKAHWIVAAATVFIFLSPAKYAVRKAGVGMSEAGFTERAAESLTVWRDQAAFSWSDAAASISPLDMLTRRTSSLLALAQIVQWVPSVVPFNNGAGLETTALYFVPRVIWRDKPGISDLINNRFAIAFGYASAEGVEQTTFGITQPGDGYWDFGVLGALLYPALLGLLVGWVSHARSKGSHMSLIIQLLFSAFFFQSLSAFQNILASLFTFFVGCWLALFAINATAELTGTAPRTNPHQRTPGTVHPA
ncbi:MAG TPA: hypothetical protein VMT45_08060 [Thermoanaerobaculaceae bacterium]|nr:hypothetical protein [Thermoanaerobaculaceae bacterium]